MLKAPIPALKSFKHDFFGEECSTACAIYSSKIELHS